MDALESFREELAELERIQAAMAAASKSGEGDWRRELIDLRRKLQSQISAVALALGNCQSLGAEDGVRRELRDALSNMRSALALHQANWPAVSIDPSNPDYAQSTANVRAANRVFIDLARRVLAQTGSGTPTHSNRSE